MHTYKATKVSWMKICACLEVILFVFHPLVGLTIPRYFTIVFFALQVTSLMMRNQKLRVLPYTMGYICFAAYGALSIIWCVSLGNAFVRILNLIYCTCLVMSLATCCLMRDNHETENRCENLMDVYLLSMSIIVLLCYITEGRTLLSWARLGKTLYSGSDTNQIYFTCYLVVATYIAIRKIFISRSLSGKIMATTLAMWLYISCVLTGVRKIVVLPLIFLYAYQLLKNRKYVIKVIGITILTILISVALLGIVMRFSSSFAYRMNTLILTLQGQWVEGSYTERSWLREAAVRCFKEHPIFGIGLGNFRNYSVMNGGPDLYAHNNWLEVLSCTGLIGFALYYGSQAILFFKLIKNRTEPAIFFGAFIVTNWASDYYQVSYYYEPIIMMLGLASIMLSIQNKKIYKKPNM